MWLNEGVHLQPYSGSEYSSKYIPQSGYTGLSGNFGDSPAPLQIRKYPRRNKRDDKGYVLGVRRGFYESSP